MRLLQFPTNLFELARLLLGTPNPPAANKLCRESAFVEIEKKKYTPGLQQEDSASAARKLFAPDYGQSWITDEQKRCDCSSTISLKKDGITIRRLFVNL